MERSTGQLVGVRTALDARIVPLAPRKKPSSPHGGHLIDRPIEGMEAMTSFLMLRDHLDRTGPDVSIGSAGGMALPVRRAEDGCGWRVRMAGRPLPEMGGRT